MPPAAEPIPSSGASSRRLFFSLAKPMPAGPVATYSGLMPNGSRAPNSTRSRESQISKANIPRSRLTAAAPQWWYAATIASVSPSVANVAPWSRASSARNSR